MPVALAAVPLRTYSTKLVLLNISSHTENVYGPRPRQAGRNLIIGVKAVSKKHGKSITDGMQDGFETTPGTAVREI